MPKIFDRFIQCTMIAHLLGLELERKVLSIDEQLNGVGEYLFDEHRHPDGVVRRRNPLQQQYCTATVLYFEIELDKLACVKTIISILQN